MKRIITYDGIPAVIAAFTAYCLLTSILYNYAYFYNFGLDNIGLLSITDYLNSAVISIPSCFGMLIWLSISIIITDRFIKPKMLNSKEKNIKNSIGKNLLYTVLLLALISIVIYLITPFFYNHNYSIFIIITLLILSNLWSTFILSSTLNILSKPSALKIVVAVIPLAISLPIIYGNKDAKDDRKANISYITINGIPEQKGKIIRYLEKGVLLYSPCDWGMKFISWNEVKDIRYTYFTTHDDGCNNY